MGGQMQEASMMDQEAMMAQQGGPSPEEMAMMQNEMMGQQEGMMRSGGKIPKSVLLSRAKSHMSDAAAQEYVKNYDNGSNLSGPYPRHSIGLGYKRPVYPMTEEEARRQKIYEGPYKDHVEMLNDIDLAFDNPTALVTGEQLAGDKSSFKDYLKWWDSPPSYLHLRRGPADLPPEAEKLGGYLGDGKSSFGGGGYMSRSYAPGGFMGMGMANANTFTDPCPCGTPGCDPCPGKETGFTTTTKTRDTSNAIQDFSPHLSWTEEAGFEDDRIMQDIRQSMISNLGAVGTSTDPAYGDGIGEFPDKKRTGKFKEFVGKVKDDFVDKRENIKAFRQKPNSAGRRYTHMNRALNVFRPKNDRIRNSGNMRFAVKHPRATQDAQGNNLRALSNLFLGVPDKSKWVGRFGEDKMRRGGGKLCYGCGGAMHAYGGRLLDDNQMFDGGKIVRGLGTLMKTAGNFIPLPGVGTAISAAGAGFENFDTGADAKEVIKDIGLAALPGVAGGITKTLNLPDTVKEKAFKGVTDIASQGADMIQTATQDQDKSQQNLQIALENASPEQKQQILKDQQIEAGIQGMASTFGNLFKPQQEETIGDVQDFLPMNNVARYGRKLDKGGGLWANIQAKKERMGKNYRPAQPGDKDYPTEEAIEAAQQQMGGRLFYPGGYLFGPAGEAPPTPIPDPVEKQDDTYGSDMPSSFIDMSTGTNPLGLVSPMYNLGMGLFGQESDLSYPVEKFTYKPFDFTESKNALRRQAAKALDSLRKTGNTNPSNILALKNLNAQTEAAYLERAENINAQREQAAADNNTKLMNKYNKELRELRLKNEAIRDEFIKAGLQDLTSFAEQERQNEYMFNFLKTMAPNVVTGSYNSIFDIFNRKDKKDKKDK
jgi:hypothetical protein